jgi:hypothetical protein
MTAPLPFDPPDWAVVSAMVRGAAWPRVPRASEWVAAVRHMAGHGYSDAQIAARLGRAPRTIARIRAAHRIEGLPVGTNGLTRPRQDI